MPRAYRPDEPTPLETLTPPFSSWLPSQEISGASAAPSSPVPPAASTEMRPERLKLIVALRDTLRVRHYSRRTEKRTFRPAPIYETTGQREGGWHVRANRKGSAKPVEGALAGCR